MNYKEIYNENIAVVYFDETTWVLVESNLNVPMCHGPKSGLWSSEHKIYTNPKMSRLVPSAPPSPFASCGNAILAPIFLCGYQTIFWMKQMFATCSRALPMRAAQYGYARIELEPEARTPAFRSPARREIPDFLKSSTNEVLFSFQKFSRFSVTSNFWTYAWSIKFSFKK